MIPSSWSHFHYSVVTFITRQYSDYSQFSVEVYHFAQFYLSISDAKSEFGRSYIQHVFGFTE